MGPSGARWPAHPGWLRAQVSAAYLGLIVLEAMGLVHHQAGPLDGAQDGLVDGDELVGREQDVEFDLHFFLEGESGVWGRAGRQAGRAAQRRR